jgi:hypothetical protein
MTSISPQGRSLELAMMTSTSTSTSTARARRPSSAPAHSPAALSLKALTGLGLDEQPARRHRLDEDLGMGALLRFKAMMGVEGQSVHVARMCYDRLYAYERIACAHTSARDPLRRLALELFQAYHRRDEARGFAA